MTRRVPLPGAASPAAAGGLAAYRGVRVLLTGATGFIGRHLWRALDRAGAEAWVVGRRGDRLEGEAAASGSRATRVVADLAEPGALLRLCERARPSLVLNLAGYGVGRGERSPELYRRINAEVAREAAEAAARLSDGWTGQRLVHLGSAFEYGCVPHPIDETTAARPGTPYGVWKLAGTLAVAAARERDGTRACTVRVCTVYGPGEHPHRLLPSAFRAARTGEPLELTAGEQERDFTHVGDVAEGVLRLGALPDVPPIVNLATGVTLSVRRFAEVAAEVAGLPATALRFGARPYAPDEVWQGPVRVERLVGLLGWRPSTPAIRGIRQTWSSLSHLEPAAP
jgi:nucleoside-diphosphate-sugar epimerase